MAQELMKPQPSSALVEVKPVGLEALENSSNLVPENYQGASLLKLTEGEMTILKADAKEEEIEIRPDGWIYLPQVFVRDVLNQAFGPGQWALVRNNLIEDQNVVFYDGSLYVRGCFVSRAIGEAVKHENNKGQTWATVAEAAKSDCIVRCSKDLGIAKSIWSKRFANEWRKKFAIQVHVKGGKKRWRRTDAEPFDDETWYEYLIDLANNLSSIEELNAFIPENKDKLSTLTKTEKDLVASRLKLKKDILTKGDKNGVESGSVEKPNETTTTTSTTGSPEKLRFDDTGNLTQEKVAK